jgi:hypothetical protein
MGEPEPPGVLSKKVYCVNPDCELQGVVYEIPYSMLMSIGEEVGCGGCFQMTQELMAKDTALLLPPINVAQVAEIMAQGKTTFFGSDEEF